MSTAIATVTAEDIAAYQAESAKPKSGDGLPRLKIRSSAEDESGQIILGNDGKPLGGGAYYIDGYDVNQKEVRFLPMVRSYQYTKLTEDFKLDSSSIFFKDWAREPLDSKGGVRCGRPAAKAMKKLDVATQDKWRKEVPCSMHVMGLAFFNGGPAEGIPVDFRVAGGKFAAVAEALDGVKDWNNNYFTLSTERDTNGGTVFYNVIMKSTGEKVQLTPFIISTLVGFNTYLNSYNDKIIEKHTQTTNDAYSNAQAEGVMSNIIEAKDYTEVVLNSDLPF